MDNYTFGIGFLIGGGVYSLVNMLMKLKNVPQGNILSYNYPIFLVKGMGILFQFIRGHSL